MTFLGFHGFNELFVYVTSFLVGISMIIGVNAVNSAPSFMLNYFQYIDHNEDAVAKNGHFWTNVLTFYTVVTQVTQMLVEPTNLTRFCQRFSIIFRLEAASVLMITELLMVVIMPHTLRSETSGMVGLLIAAFIGGVGRGYFENTCYALFGPFPPRYIAGVMSGVPVSGVIVSILQIILLAAMDNTFDSILTESIIYFAVSLSLIFLTSVCIVLLLVNSFARRYVAEFRSERSVFANIYRNVDYDPLAQEVLRAAHGTQADRAEENSKSNAAADGAATQSDNAENEPAMGEIQLQTDVDNKEKKLEEGSENEELEVRGMEEAAGITTAEMLQEVKLLPIMKKIWPMMLSCFLVFCVTYLMYPGVLLAVDDSDNWYTTLIMAVYNFTDLIGRLLTMSKRLWPPRKVVFAASFVRIIFIPLLVLCAKHIIPTQVAPYIITGFMGLTCGYFGTMTMVYSPETPGLASSAERSCAGQLTGVSLLMGCAVGSLLQLAIVLGL